MGGDRADDAGHVGAVVVAPRSAGPKGLAREGEAHQEAAGSGPGPVGRADGNVARYGPLAQLVAHLHDTQGVVGSSPARPT